MSVSAGYGSNLLEKTPDVPRRTLRELFINVSESAIDLIKKLIIFNPTHRLTAVEALEHSYVAKYDTVFTYHEDMNMKLISHVIVFIIVQVNLNVVST